jgi:glycosyltransferase involved in cell wall biosynthesis
LQGAALIGDDSTTFAPAGARRTVMLLLSDLGLGGAERQTVQLAHLLGDRFDVVLGHLKADSDLVKGDNSTARLIRPERLKAVIGFDVRRRIDRAAIGRLRQAIVTHRVEAVLCANTCPLLYAQLARWRLHGALRVVEIYHTTLIASGSSRLKLLAFRPLFWSASQLVFVCEAQRRHCVRRALWSPRVSVIHNGVDTRHFSSTALPSPTDTRRQLGFARDDRVVGLCAVFRPEKAHVDLLAAVATLKSRGIAWKVMLIGDGPTRPRIEAAIERLGLTGDVCITGFLGDVRAAVAACDVIALVSTSIETFSIAALEAMALGKPMLMSDIGGAAELVEPGVNGELFPAGDVPALAQRLQGFGNRERCAAMGAAARSRVERLFSQETMRERYIELIDDLLPARDPLPRRS